MGLDSWIFKLLYLLKVHMVLYGQRNFAERKTFLSAAPHRLRGGKCAVTPCTSRRAAFGSKVLPFHPFLKTRNVWCLYQKVSLFEIPPLSCKWEESGKEGCQSDLRDFSEKMNTNLNTEKKSEIQQPLGDNISRGWCRVYKDGRARKPPLSHS